MSKFKVGQRVRLVKDGGYVANAGAEAVVTSVGERHIEVVWDRGNGLARHQGDGGYMTDCFDAVTSISATRYPAYYKDVSSLTVIDVYGVHKLFGIDDPSGAIQHASKKLLLSGVRTGGKSKVDDVREARDTLTRWLELEAGE